MKKYTLIIIAVLVLIIAGTFWYTSSTKNSTKKIILQTSLEYKNIQYGFSFILPLSWEGYSIVDSEWTGWTTGVASGGSTAEKGPIISIRHPLWSEEVKRQDIPIMIFTIDQWNLLSQDKFHIGAAPINPSELGRNSKYVFALPARYNYAFPVGYEEVDTILKNNSLNAF